MSELFDKVHVFYKANIEKDPPPAARLNLSMLDHAGDIRQQVRQFLEICPMDTSGHARVATNDYAILRLIEMEVWEAKGDLIITNVDSGKECKQVVDIQPFPTLAIYEELFKYSVQRALKE